MNFRSYLLSFLLLSPVFSNAQVGRVVDMGYPNMAFMPSDGIIDNMGNCFVLGHHLIGQNDHACVTKFDPWFGELWSYTFNFNGGTGKVVQAIDGNYLAASSTGVTADVFKISQSGTMMWYHHFTNVYVLYDMWQDNNGDIYVCGNTLTGVCVMKLDAAGNITWCNQYNKSPACNSMNGFCIRPTFDGKLVVAGNCFTMANTPQNELFVMKIDRTAGNVSWSKVFRAPVSMVAHDIAESDIDHSLVICGMSSDGSGPTDMDALILKTDMNGNYLFNKNFANLYDDQFNGIALAGEGSFMLVGNTKPTATCGGNVFFAKINSLADTLFTRTYGNSSGTGAIFNHLKNAAGGEFYTFGSGTLWGRINGGIEHEYLRVDSLAYVTCSLYPQGYNIDTLAITLTGTVSGSAFPPTSTSTYTMGADTLYAVDGCTSQVLAVQDEFLQNEFNVYPVPCSDHFTLQGAYANNGFCVTDILGKIYAEEKQSSEPEVSVSTSSWPSGIYLLVPLDGKLRARRIVVSH